MRSIRSHIRAPFGVIAIFLLCASIFASLAIIHNTSAAFDFDNAELDAKNRSASYYVTLQGCVQNNMYGTIDAENTNYSPSSVNWFDDNNAYGYIYTEGKTDCRDVMIKALTLWDITPEAFLKGLKYEQKSSTSYKWTGTGDGNARRSNFESYVKSVLATSNPADAGAAAEYQRYSTWWQSQCVVKSFGDISALTDDVIKERINSGYTESTGTYSSNKYVKIKQPDGKEWGYSYKHKASSSSGRGGAAAFSYTTYGYHTTAAKATCDDTVSKLGGSSLAAYNTYSNALAVTSICKSQGYQTITASSSNPVGVYTLTACENGYANKSKPTYCATTYTPKTINYQGATIENTQKAEQDACLYGRSITPEQLAAAVNGIVDSDIPPPDGGGGDDTATSCVVDGIGWMVCPLLNAFGGLSDAMYGWIDSVLRLQPLSLSSESPQFIAWQSIRNIANVLLVIAFLVIIFSQLTSMGVSNYGVKKTLPRLVIVALAINTSFYLMAIAVDLTNIIGVGLHSIFSTLAPDADASTMNAAGVIGALVTGTGTAIVAGTAITFAAASAGSFSTLALMALPVIGVAILGLLAAVATLFIRNALVVVLIVISPLAFAAYLLPNTQSLFAKWRKLFISMLVLFPMAALLFGGSKFAASVIVTADQPLSALAAIFIMAVPLGMLPWLVKSSNSLLGNIGGRLSGLASKARNPLTRATQGAVDKSKAASLAGRRNMFGFKQKPGRTNMAQRMNNRRMSREAEIGNLKGESEENWREMAISGTGGGKNGKAAARAQAALKGQQDHSTRKGRNDARAQEMHTARINTPGSVIGQMDTEAREAKLATARNEAQTQARFDQRVQNSAALTNTQQATRRAEEVSKTVKAEQDHAFEQVKSTDATLLGLRDRQADAQLKTAALTEQSAVQTQRRQQADPGLLDVRLATEASKKERGALDQQITEQVAAAGTTAGAAELIANGVSSSTISQLQDAHESQADSQLRTAAYTEQASAETERRQMSDLDLVNTRLGTEASKRERGALNQQVSQMVEEGSTQDGGDALVSMGVDQGIVDSLRTSQVTSSIASSATNSAKNVQQVEYAKQIEASAPMAAAAGGIDPQGMDRVVAGAKSVITDVVNKAIGMEKSTMSYTAVTDSPTGEPGLASIYSNGGVDTSGKPLVSAERRAAAAGQIFKVGSDEQILQMLNDVSAMPTNTPDEREAKKLIMQQIAADMGSRKPTALGAADVSALARGDYSGVIEDKIGARFSAGKISPENLYATSADELQRMITVFSSGYTPATPEAAANIAELKTQIEVYKTSPTFKPASPEIAALINKLEAEL